MWKKNDVLIKEVSVPSTITLEKPHLFRPSMVELPIVKRVSLLDFLVTFDKKINDEVDEINITFVSDLRDITFLHYMTQPKTMLCKKRIGNFLEENYDNFDYNWLPNCFRKI